MTGPLDGVRVVDLSAIISGPMATQILADQRWVSRLPITKTAR